MASLHVDWQIIPGDSCQRFPVAFHYDKPVTEQLAARQEATQPFGDTSSEQGQLGVGNRPLQSRPNQEIVRTPVVGVTFDFNSSGRPSQFRNRQSNCLFDRLSVKVSLALTGHARSLPQTSCSQTTAPGPAAYLEAVDRERQVMAAYSLPSGS